jgi:tetratricopeptide (TPR) repeat protein
MFYTVILLLFYSGVSAQENPFLKMAGISYSEYCHELGRILYGMGHDDIWTKPIAAQLRETSKITKEKKWELEADLLLLIHIEKGGRINKYTSDSLSEICIAQLHKIIQQAQKIKATDVELRTMRELSGWHNYKMDYQRQFACDKVLDQRLSRVTAKEFPFKYECYAHIGDLYYHFHEYEKAKSFYEKGLESMTVVKAIDVRELKNLWNNIGLIYRNHYHDLDKSDSCFNKILEIELLPDETISYDENVARHTQLLHEIWMGIAKGNLGSNLYLRGDYDAAIPLLIEGIEQVMRHEKHNYPYALSKAVTLSKIFIEKRDLSSAKGLLWVEVNTATQRFIRKMAVQ